MKRALIYSAKVWLTTTLLAPILFLLIFEFMHGNEHESGLIFLLIPIMMIAGSVCSLPYWFLLAFTVRWLGKNHNGSNSMNLFCYSIIVAILSAVSIVAWHRTSGVSLDLAEMVILYVLAGVASVWFYKLKPVQQQKLSA